MNKKILSTSLFLAVAGIATVSAQTVTFVEAGSEVTNEDQQYCGERVEIKFVDGMVSVEPTKGNSKQYTIGEDGSVQIVCNSAKVEPIQLNVPAGSTNGVASYVCTEAIDLTKSVGRIYGYVATTASTTKVNLKTQMQFKAGEAMILSGAPGWHCLPVATGAITPAAKNLFLGSPTDGHTVLTGEKTYALSKTYGTLNPVTVGLTIPAKKAYLTLPSSTQGSTLALSFDFDEEDATAISTTPVSVEAEGNAYTVGGQRANANEKGIVIKNGVKVAM